LIQKKLRPHNLRSETVQNIFEMTEPTDASGGLPEIETDEMDVENPTVDVPEAPMTPTPKPPTGPVPRSVRKVVTGFYNSTI
jgi:hypothetical protein